MKVDLLQTIQAVKEYNRSGDYDESKKTIQAYSDRLMSLTDEYPSLNISEITKGLIGISDVDRA